MLILISGSDQDLTKSIVLVALTKLYGRRFGCLAIQLCCLSVFALNLNGMCFQLTKVLSLVPL